MSVDTTTVARVVEGRKAMEREEWRLGCEREREREQAKGRHREVSYSTNYTEVVATSGWKGHGGLGAVGDGRGTGLEGGCVGGGLVTGEGRWITGDSGPGRELELEWRGNREGYLVSG